MQKLQATIYAASIGMNCRRQFMPGGNSFRNRVAVARYRMICLDYVSLPVSLETIVSSKYGIHEYAIAHSRSLS